MIASPTTPRRAAAESGYDVISDAGGGRPRLRRLQRPPTMHHLIERTSRGPPLADPARPVTCRRDVIVLGLLLGNATLVCLLPQVSAGGYRTPVSSSTLLSSSTPCIHEGHLKTEKNWFGYLANITIIGSGRLTFEFVYPVERCCQNILFYRHDQIAIIGARMNCWQKEYLLRPEEDQILRLTPSFSWSGCHTESSSSSSAFFSAADPGDDDDDADRHPTSTDVYVCKGGRSFTVDESVREPVTWFIAVSNCATLHGLDLRYAVEVHGQIGDCRPLPVDRQTPSRDVDRSPASTRRPPPQQPAGSASTPGEDAAAAAAAAVPAKASLTPREAAIGVGDDDDDACIIEGDVNTTKNWYGFLANLTLSGASGRFRFDFTYPYDMQIQYVILYEEDDITHLHWEQTCWQKEMIIPARRFMDKVLDLSYRATWNGCEAQKVLYSEDPINVTCNGEKSFIAGNNNNMDGATTRKIFLALSNCRSEKGLLLHYRLRVYGNADPGMCIRNGAAKWGAWWVCPPYVEVVVLSLTAVAIGRIVDWITDCGSDV